MFRRNVRVYYEDTDAGGIVYHANYLKFMERTRCDWLDAVGHSVTDLIEQHELMFVVKSAALDFRQPAYLFDELIVTVATQKVGKVKMTLEQSVFRRDTLLCNATIVLGTLDTQTFAPRAMPPSLLSAIAENE